MVMRSLSPLPSRTSSSPRANVDVLHAQAQTFHEAQAGSIKQHRHDPGRAAELAQQSLDLAGVQHHRQTVRSLGANDTVEPAWIASQHIPVEE
jgi:hypothetical protein